MAEKSKVWLVAGSRTPIGSFGRSLKDVTVDKLTEHVFKHAIRRSGVEPSKFDGIMLGHGYQSAYTPNTARFSALNAGLPASIPAMTVQRQCGSGMQAVNLASNEIMLGNGDLYLAGGAESMSTVPYLVPGKARFNGPLASDFVLSKIGGRLGPRPFVGLADGGLVPMCLFGDLKSTNMTGTAQRLADTYGITREESDKYSLRSQQLAQAAIKSGRFAEEIDPIQTPSGKFLVNDEHPRETTLEKLSSLRPVFKTKQITAGNSSGINDAACAVVVASDKAVKENGLEPIAQLVDSCVVGLDYEQMGLGPVLAIKKILKRNNLEMKDIDLIEINEAFAAQYLACEKLLELDRDKVNVNGGAIALGHPIGMSGARLILTLALELKKRGLKRGIASACIGGGMGIATLIESPN
jgi:acetyl-CoA C-acetyltransferase